MTNTENYKGLLPHVLRAISQRREEDGASKSMNMVEKLLRNAQADPGRDTYMLRRRRKRRGNGNGNRRRRRRRSRSTDAASVVSDLEDDEIDDTESRDDRSRSRTPQILKARRRRKKGENGGGRRRRRRRRRH